MEEEEEEASKSAFGFGVTSSYLGPLGVGREGGLQEQQLDRLVKGGLELLLGEETHAGPGRGRFPRAPEESERDLAP